jgi:hypothetical protein
MFGKTRRRSHPATPGKLNANLARRLAKIQSKTNDPRTMEALVNSERNLSAAQKGELKQTIQHLFGNANELYEGPMNLAPLKNRNRKGRFSLGGLFGKAPKKNNTRRVVPFNEPVNMGLPSMAKKNMFAPNNNLPNLFGPAKKNNTRRGSNVNSFTETLNASSVSASPVPNNNGRKVLAPALLAAPPTRNGNGGRGAQRIIPAGAPIFKRAPNGGLIGPNGRKLAPALLAPRPTRNGNGGRGAQRMTLKRRNNGARNLLGSYNLNLELNEAGANNTWRAAVGRTM